MSRDPLDPSSRGTKPKPPEIPDSYDLADPLPEPEPVRRPTRPRPMPTRPSAEVGGDSTFQPAPKPPRPESPRASRLPGPKGSPKQRAERAFEADAASYRPGLDDLDPPAQAGRGVLERIKLGGVHSGDLAQFCRQLGVYLHSGVGTIKALDSLAKQYRGTAFGPLTERLGAAVRRGDSLTEAAAREPWAFDRLFLSMMRVAEARGGVPETLKVLSKHYEAKRRMIKQARSALIYPTAVILITLVVGGLLTIFVLPKLVDILEDFTRGKGVTLPLPTRILVGTSHFIQAFGWWLIPLAAVGTFFGLIWAYRKPVGKAVLDRVALRIPVMGNLLSKIDTARFARTLSDLLGAGVGFGDSLTLTSEVLQLDPYRSATLAIREEVQHGEELGQAIKDSGRFDHEVIAFIETGEETGNLPEGLGRLASEYEERVEHMVKNLASLLQPLIIIVLGSIVGFVAVAFVLAYVSVIASLASGF